MKNKICLTFICLKLSMPVFAQEDALMIDAPPLPPITSQKVLDEMSAFFASQQQQAVSEAVPGLSERMSAAHAKAQRAAAELEQRVAPRTCVNVNFSKNITPVDQGPNGLCWAVSATYAAQQALAKAGIAMAPSVPDMMSCASKKKNGTIIDVAKFGAREAEGGRPINALQCFLGKGACSAEYASYESYREAQINPDFQKDIKSCVEQAQLQRSCDGGGSSSVAGSGLLDKMLHASKNITQSELCLEAPELMAPEGACYVNRLIGDKCRNNRMHMPGAENLTARELYLENKNPTEKLMVIRSLLQQGVAPILSVCLDQVNDAPLQKMLGAQFSSSTISGSSGNCMAPHALTIVGEDCNGDILVKGSWGPENKILEGPVAISNIIGAVKDVTYIGAAK